MSLASPSWQNTHGRWDQEPGPKGSWLFPGLVRAWLGPRHGAGSHGLSASPPGLPCRAPSYSWAAGAGMGSRPLGNSSGMQVAGAASSDLSHEGAGTEVAAFSSKSSPLLRSVLSSSPCTVQTPANSRAIIQELSGWRTSTASCSSRAPPEHACVHTPPHPGHGSPILRSSLGVTRGGDLPTTQQGPSC